MFIWPKPKEDWLTVYHKWATTAFEPIKPGKSDISFIYFGGDRLFLTHFITITVQKWITCKYDDFNIRTLWVRKTSLLGLYVGTCSCRTEKVNKRAISSFLWTLSYDYSYNCPLRWKTWWGINIVLLFYSCTESAIDNKLSVFILSCRLNNHWPLLS